MIEFKLPGEEELGRVLDGILASAGLPALEIEMRQAALSAATGLTTMEAENAFALSIVRTGGIDPSLIGSAKAATIKKSGILEVVEAHGTLQEIGGLDRLKQWLRMRKEAFREEARAYGLPVPKGCSSWKYPAPANR